MCDISLKFVAVNGVPLTNFRLRFMLGGKGGPPPDLDTVEFAPTPRQDRATQTECRGDTAPSPEICGLDASQYVAVGLSPLDVKQEPQDALDSQVDDTGRTHSSSA